MQRILGKGKPSPSLNFNGRLPKAKWADSELDVLHTASPAVEVRRNTESVSRRADVLHERRSRIQSRVSLTGMIQITLITYFSLSDFYNFN